MELDGSTPDDGSHQKVTWWMRVRGIPPMLALTIKDRFGELHVWRLKVRDDFKHILLRAWSIRVIIFGGFIQGLLLIWSALVDVLPLWIYVTVGILTQILAVVARCLKQPGFEE